MDVEKAISQASSNPDASRHVFHRTIDVNHARLAIRLTSFNIAKYLEFATALPLRPIVDARSDVTEGHVLNT